MSKIQYYIQSISILYMKLLLENINSYVHKNIFAILYVNSIPFPHEGFFCEVVYLCVLHLPYIHLRRAQNIFRMIKHNSIWLSLLLYLTTFSYPSLQEYWLSKWGGNCYMLLVLFSCIMTLWTTEVSNLSAICCSLKTL